MPVTAHDQPVRVLVVEDHDLYRRGLVRTLRAHELLVYVARHAGARRVGVGWRVEGRVELQVEDDGRGLDPVRARRAPLDGRIGLASAAERLDALGGVLHIDSDPGGGARIRASFPLPRRGVGTGGRLG